MVSQIVERIRQKDQRAMSQFYQMYVKELSSVCYRYVPDEDDAKDVLQNSFVKIFTAIPTFKYQGEKPFKGWLKRIVANEALVFLRQRKKMLLTAQDMAEATDVDEEPDVEEVTPDELHSLISHLPDGYRMVVNLYVFEGYSHREIASLLGVSEHTSASQYYHAKRLLAQRIKELINNKR
jgi:RNA polymerase sigma-70 factor (ECF subfamily)